MDRNGYNESIMTGWERICYFTKSTDCDLVRHEVYYGGNRKISKANGFWVYLKPELHNMSKHSVHYDKQMDLALKQDVQRKFEEIHSRQEFMQLIGKNYLED